MLRPQLYWGMVRAWTTEAAAILHPKPGRTNIKSFPGRLYKEHTMPTQLKTITLSQAKIPLLFLKKIQLANFRVKNQDLAIDSKKFDLCKTPKAPFN